MGNQDFLEKIRNYGNIKEKIIKENIEDFGEIEFQRPKSGVILDYLESISSEDEENIDIKLMAKESSKFIYNCCSNLRAKDIRNSEEFIKLDPNDIPLEIFGATQVIELASNIFSRFEGKKEKEKIKDNVKNSLDPVENMEKATGSLITSQKVID